MTEHTHTKTSPCPKCGNGLAYNAQTCPACGFVTTTGKLVRILSIPTLLLVGLVAVLVFA